MLKSHPDAVLSSLIDEVDHPAFSMIFMERVRSILSCDLAMISLFEDGVLKRVLHEPRSPLDNDEFSHRYLRGTYHLNPFYSHYCTGLATGVYRAKELLESSQNPLSIHDADDVIFDSNEELGYLTPGWPKNLREVSLAMRFSESRTAQVVLLRESLLGFDDSELDSLYAYSQSLTSIFLRGINRSYAESNSPPDADTVPVTGLELLSVREREVIELILKGWSVQEISTQLSLGQESVRTYRKRAYSKLQLDSRTSLFIKALQQFYK